MMPHISISSHITFVTGMCVCVCICVCVCARVSLSEITHKSGYDVVT